MSTDDCMKYYQEPNNLSCEERHLDFKLDPLAFRQNVNKYYNTDPFKFNEDYKTLTNEELCGNTQISLKPQQKFLGQYINPLTNSYGNLIYHGLGSGKTATSIVIAEAFKTKINNVIFAVPAPLIQQYYEEIIGQSEENNIVSQCIIEGKRDSYLLDKDNKKLQQFKNEYDKIKHDLEIETNQEKYKLLQRQFNLIKEKLNIQIARNNSKIEKYFKITSHQKFINDLIIENKATKTYSTGILLQNGSELLKENTLLVIDEIQRFISEKGKLYDKLKTAINFYIHPKVRLCFMSATPIYNDPFELGLLMNLLRPNYYFPLKKELFYKEFIGQIKENDDGSIDCVESDTKFLTLDSCVINKDILKTILSKNISYFRGGNPNAYPYKRIITLEHLMNASQISEYSRVLATELKPMQKEIENGKLLDDTNESSDIISVFAKSREYSNTIKPLSQITIKDQDLFTLCENNYSTKLPNIINLSITCNGPVFIYSNYLEYGVYSLALLLESKGYKRYPEPGEKRYFIWSGQEMDKDLIKKARNDFNSLTNINGSILHIMLGTQSVMEGVSFKNVKQLHITEPWWNESRIEQIMARAVRFCSHSNLPLEDQYVDIFRHYSVINDEDPIVQDTFQELNLNKNFKNFDSISIEQYLSILSNKKKNIINELENIIKESAYDCDINYNGNLIRLEEIIRPISGNKFQIYYRNPTTLTKFKRESVPDNLTFDEIIERKYSFPNITNNNFTEIFIDDEELKEYPDSKKLSLNSDLILEENIECNNLNNNIISDIIINTTLNMRLLPFIRKKYLNEKKMDNKITFNEKPLSKVKDLRNCLKKINEESLLKGKGINKLLKSTEYDKKIIRLIKEGHFNESDLQELRDMALNPETNSDFNDMYNELIK